VEDAFLHSFNMNTQLSLSQINLLQCQCFDGGFLQSNEWRAFQEAIGRRTFRMLNEAGIATCIEHTLPIVGRYWYCPRGPILGEASPKEQERFVKDLVDMGRKAKIGFLRIEPPHQEVLDLFEKQGVACPRSPHTVQPQEILVMSLDANEETLLSQMKSKTRYNIRLAEKKGVTTRMTHNRAMFERFCDLIEETARRDGIVAHPRSYYELMWETLPESMLQLFVAEYQGQVLAANLVIMFGAYTTYAHGASSNHHREVMAPFLLQWRQIQYAKKSGYIQYDFGGLHTGEMMPRWTGITRFKRGFAPQVATRHGLGTYDIVLDASRYRGYRLLQRLKHTALRLRSFWKV
jgi:lipid II:glycine glycyltransferase (peptidoglycan interpeptide bridge formation enzyme)